MSLLSVSWSCISRPQLDQKHNSFGKELFILFAASAFRKLSSIYVFSYFPFGFGHNFIAFNILRFPENFSYLKKTESYLKFSLLLAPEEEKWKDKICKHFQTVLFAPLTMRTTMKQRIRAVPLCLIYRDIENP